MAHLARLADVMAGKGDLERIAPGTYRVRHDQRTETVYVAGEPGTRWAFWNGRVFRESPDSTDNATSTSSAAVHTRQTLTAPMPATVIQVLCTPGAAVRKGDTLIVLEAMKMELPIRAPADATVTAVRCREGELVQPDATLVEFA